MNTCLRILLIACSVGAVFAAEGAGDDYAAKRDELRQLLKPRSVNADVVAKAQAFVDGVGDDAGRQAEALGFLGSAQEKAGQDAEAVETYLRRAKVQQTREHKDMPRWVYDDRVRALRCLDRVKPPQGDALRALAEESLAWQDGQHWNAGQQLEFCKWVAKGIEKSTDTAAAVAWLDGRVAATEDASLRGSLLLHQAALAEGDKKQACYDAVLADEAIPAQDKMMAFMQQAQQVERLRRYEEALQLAAQALPFIKQLQDAEAKLGWQEMNSIKWAGCLARDKVADYAMAHTFFDCFLALADGDYWGIPGKKEMALLLAKEDRFAEAEALFIEVSESNEKNAAQVAIPYARMVLFAMQDDARGKPMLDAALANEQVNIRERINTVRDLAARMLARGDRDGAIAWYARIPELPGGKNDVIKESSRTWYEIGQIHESRADMAKAKAFYAQARDNTGGDAQFRVRARNAIEAIAYFE